MKRSKRLVVTGASGFLGRGLVAYLAHEGHDVLALSRSPAAFDHSGVAAGTMPDLADPHAAWDGLLQPNDVVVHLAGLAHGSLDDDRHDSINHQGAMRLAEAAARASVAQLIFVSSIAAQTGPAASHMLTEADDPKPVNAYGRAKLAAERAVAGSGVAYTILRPGVIYGEDAKGNLRLLERLAQLPVPLPLAGVSARRSLLSAANFNSAVGLVLMNQAAINKIFLVADPAPLSVAEMITGLRRQMGRRPGLFYVHPVPLKAALTVLGLKSVWTRIGEPFVISTDRLQGIGWRPHGPEPR
jgi:nucleoside-diphosphate-sugar epimerase